LRLRNPTKDKAAEIVPGRQLLILLMTGKMWVKLHPHIELVIKLRNKDVKREYAIVTYLRR